MSSDPQKQSPFQQSIPKLTLQTVFNQQGVQPQSAREQKHYDRELQIEYYKLNKKELTNVTKLLVKNIQSKLTLYNKRRLKALAEKAEAEKARDGKRTYKQNLEGIPLTQRWKHQTYEHFRLPLNEYIERQRSKKDAKTFNMPYEVTNYIEGVVTEKERGQSESGESTLESFNKARYAQQMCPGLSQKQFSDATGGGIASTKKSFFEDKQIAEAKYKQHLQKGDPILIVNYRSTPQLPQLVESPRSINEEIKTVSKYKDYFELCKPVTGLPNTGMTQQKLKLQEKTDLLVKVIRNCDYFRQGYQSTQSQLKQSLAADESILEEKFKILSKSGKRYIYLRQDNRSQLEKTLPRVA